MPQVSKEAQQTPSANPEDSSIRTKQFFVAHARGSDFAQLKKLGFMVFYPAMDDYVFLEVNKQNEKFLSQQEALHVKFLRTGKGAGKLQKIPGSQLIPLMGTTVDPLQPDAEILVVDGYCEGLEGKVLSRDTEHVLVELRGFKKTYKVCLPTAQLVLRGREVIKEKEDVDGSSD